MRYLNLIEELIGELGKYDINIYGADVKKGSKIVEFHCDSDKINQLLNKQLYNKYHKYIIGKNSYKYYCDFTRKI